MKLNNKGFAISSIMYIILVLAVVLIFLTLATLSSRKLILDKLKSEVYNDIYDRPSITYRKVLNTLKEEVISYATHNSVEKESIKIEDMDSSIDNNVLQQYDLSSKYLTMVSNADSYDVYLGKAKTITSSEESVKKLIDIVDYKIYGNSVQTILPEEYQQVEYIESTGTQYIDTEYIPKSQNTKLIMDFQINEYNDTGGAGYYGDIFGLNSTSAPSFMLYQQKYSDDIFLSTRNGEYVTTQLLGGTLDSNNFFSKYHLEFSKTTTITDFSGGTNTITFSDYDFSTNTNSIYLFEGRLNDNYKNLKGIKIYFCEIYDENNVLVRKFIPCYRKSDGLIGMYDLVNKMFYTNKGTGKFLKGDDAPTLEAPIEIQSVADKTKNLFDNTFSKYTKPVNYWLLPIELKQGVSYTIKAELVGESMTGVAVGITSTGTQYSEFGDWKNCLDAQGRYSTQIFTVDSTWDSPKLAVYASSEEEFNRIFENYHIQLEEGKVATEYEPYGEYRISVETSGKNLFNPKYNFTGYNAYGLKIDYLEDEDCFVINGTATATMIFAERWINIPITKGEKFSISSKYVSGTITKPNTTDYAVAYFGGNDAINASNNWNNVSLAENDKIKENIQCNYDYITKFWFFISEGVSFDNYKVKVQLERGNKATEYQSYVESQITNIYLDQPLRKINDYYDFVSYKDNQLTKNTNSIILNGNEGYGNRWWYWDTSITEKTIGVYYNNPTLLGVYKSPKFKNLMGFSNYFKLGNKALNLKNDDLLDKMYFAPGSDPPYIAFKVPYTDLTSWLDYLKELNQNGNPLEVVYTLLETDKKDIELPHINISEGANIIEINTELQPSKYEFTVIEKIMKI